MKDTYVNVGKNIPAILLGITLENPRIRHNDRSVIN